MNAVPVQFYRDFCTECNAGFYRNVAGQCSPGPTPYCSKYTSTAAVDEQPACTVCNKGYNLVKISAQTTYYICVPSVPQMGCDGVSSSLVPNAEYSVDGTNANVLMKCNACDSPFNRKVDLNLA